jgi:hypothetical protein
MPDTDEHGSPVPTERRNFLQGATLAGAAMVAASTGATAQTLRGGTAMADIMTAEDVRKLLDLTPNATCGYVRVTFTY